MSDLQTWHITASKFNLQYHMPTFKYAISPGGKRKINEMTDKIRFSLCLIKLAYFPSQLHRVVKIKGNQDEVSHQIFRDLIKVNGLMVNGLI